MPPRPLAASTSPSDEAPQLRDWIGVLAMCAGLVMAIMDVQIVTSSLTQIQGGLSASSDEIAWVQTAYLIADVVMVPLSGMMTRLSSTSILFVVAALGFTGASALCATATSLGQMILYRAMQGFCGAAITGSDHLPTRTPWVVLSQNPDDGQKRTAPIKGGRRAILDNPGNTLTAVEQFGRPASGTA